MDYLEFLHEGKQLWVRIQPTPEREKRNSVLGKIAAFAMSEMDATYTARIFWNPDFNVFAESEGKDAVMLAHVEPDSRVIWDPQGLRVLQKASPEMASAALDKFRRSR